MVNVLQTFQVVRDLTHIKCISFLLWNFSFILNYPVCLSVLKLTPDEYATNASSSKWKYEKLAVVVHVLQTTQNWSFHVVVLQRTAKKSTKNYNARGEPLFCSLILLFSDVPVPVAVVVS